MRTQQRKILRDIASRKARTVMVAISIFMGVLGVVTLASGGEVLLRQLNHDLREDEIAMLSVNLENLEEGAEVDNTAVLTMLATHPGVTDVEGWSTQTFFWKTPDEDVFIESALRAFSESYSALDIEPVRLVEGEFPTPGQNQIALEQRMAERYGLSIGDTLVFRITRGLSAGAAISGNIPEENWTVTGLVFHAYTGIPESSVYTTPEDIQYITGRPGYNLIQARFHNYNTAVTQSESFENRINDQTPYQSVFASLEDPANVETIAEARQWVNAIFILAVLAMLVSVSLVITVISTIMAEQRRQIGVMKSLGASQRESFGIYTGMSLIYGLLGVLPGVIAGAFLGDYLARSVAAPIFNVLFQGFAFSPTGVAIGVVMGLSLPILASLVPVYMGTRVSILEAMSDQGIVSNYGTSRAAKIIGNLPFPVVIRQGLANVYQKKWRLALTGTTLTLAVGAFMGVSAVFLSLNNVLERAEQTLNYHINVFVNEPGNYEQIRASVEASLPDAASIQPSYGQGFDVLSDLHDEYGLQVLGIDPAGDSVHFDLLEGQSLAESDVHKGIIITEYTAGQLEVGIGDTITLLQDERAFRVQVVGIDNYAFNVAFMRWEDLAAMVRESPSDPVEPNQVLVRLNTDTPTVTDADRAIGTIREALLRNGILTGYNNQVADIESNSQQIVTGGLIFNMASGIMAAVGAIGLLATLSISVFERQREIGIMRSVGASSAAIVVQFLVEGLLVGVIAWVFGLPISYAISQIMVETLPFGNFTLEFTPLVFPLGLGGILVISGLASLWPSLAAAQRTVSDILRYQ